VAFSYIVLQAVLLASNDVSLQSQLVQKFGRWERGFEDFVQQRGLRRPIPLYNKP